MQNVDLKNRSYKQFLVKNESGAIVVRVLMLNPNFFCLYLEVHKVWYFLFSLSIQTRVLLRYYV